jgi:hypothetical protein
MVIGHPKSLHSTVLKTDDVLKLLLSRVREMVPLKTIKDVDQLTYTVVEMPIKTYLQLVKKFEGTGRLGNSTFDMVGLTKDEVNQCFPKIVGCEILLEDHWSVHV